MNEVTYAPEPAAIIQNSQSHAAYLAIPITLLGIHSTGFLPSSPGSLCHGVDCTLPGLFIAELP